MKLKNLLVLFLLQICAAAQISYSAPIPENIVKAFEKNLELARAPLKGIDPEKANPEDIKQLDSKEEAVCRKFFSEFASGKLSVPKEADYVATNSSEVIALQKEMQAIGATYLQKSIEQHQISQKSYKKNAPKDYAFFTKEARDSFDRHWAKGSIFITEREDYSYLIFKEDLLPNGEPSLFEIEFDLSKIEQGKIKTHTFKEFHWSMMNHHGLFVGSAGGSSWDTDTDLVDNAYHFIGLATINSNEKPYPLVWEVVTAPSFLPDDEYCKKTNLCTNYKLSIRFLGMANNKNNFNTLNNCKYIFELKGN